MTEVSTRPQEKIHELPVGSLSTRVFETRTATGSELFSLLTYLHTKNIYIAKYLFSIRDDWYKEDTTGRHHCPGSQNVLFRLPSPSQKRTCLSFLF